MLNRLLGNEVEITWVLAAVGIVLLVGWLVAHFAARLLRRVFVQLAGEGEDVSFKAPIVRTPIRIVWLVVFVVVAATLLTPALELAGADIGGGIHLETLTSWFLRSGLQVMLIFMLAFAITRVGGAVVHRFENRIALETGTGGVERAKRAKTLGRLIRNLVNTVIGAVATLMVLQEIGINIMPVLTGAGIAGIAVGFGAQTLVRDVISGFFIILEDQIRVGDVANIDGTGGAVEAIRMRTIVLRDLSGTVHVIPNGGITKISNLTKDFSYFVLDMGVAYKEDTDQVVGVMRQVAEEMRLDPAYATNMLEPLEVLGVNDFADSAVVIKVRLKTVPSAQWSMGREYRRRVKKAFDAARIEIPFPHLSLYAGEASKPFQLQEVGAGAGGK